jgi:hypothetical protein
MYRRCASFKCCACQYRPATTTGARHSTILFQKKIVRGGPHHSNTARHGSTRKSSRRRICQKRYSSTLECVELVSYISFRQGWRCRKIDCGAPFGYAILKIAFTFVLSFYDITSRKRNLRRGDVLCSSEGPIKYESARTSD